MDHQKTGTINPSFTLTQRQEELLYAALLSNDTTSNKNTTKPSPTVNATMAPGSLTESPVQAPGSGLINGFEESPFIDYDYEFEADGSFDYDFNQDSQGQMIGKLPGTSSDGDADNHDKRSHPEDDDDEEGGGKRREGDDRTSKKPGRKPLTSEPTSKRKAQNRAAQRAFRERKEKHLKDLETKVEDLQKSSESANHENSILRAQIEKMSMELREYRKRLSLTSGVGRSPSLNNGVPSYLAGKGLTNGAVNNPSDVNFQFEFPKFGRLPGPPVSNVATNIATTTNNGNRSSSSPSSGIQQTPSPIERQISPRSKTLQFPAGNVSATSLIQAPASLDDGGDMSSLSGLFSPSILEGVSKAPAYDFFGNAVNTSNTSNGSRSSTDSANGTGQNTSYSSPSASSNSNHGASSSCGTSPEPTMQSPMYNKPLDNTLSTIGEENSGVNAEGTFDPAAFDVNGIDWFAQQNNNQFDPQLFGDYREPQDNILAGDAFTDSFFQDAFAVDFTSPFNMAPSPLPPKKDLVAQIDEKQNEDDEVVPGEDTTQMLTCNTIWDRLQACPKVKEGEFDLDNLCKDLQKKAKCSETGAVVNESDFNKIMKSYVDQRAADKAAKATAI